jgi:polyisoprenoid-binding protein YceI
MTTAVGTETTTWSIDPGHSSAEFGVKHMMVSTVKGRFRDIEGELHIDEGDPTQSFVRAAVDVASVDTGIAQRDDHLRSDDFFNAERFPKLTFESTKIERTSDDAWTMTGDLTIRDVTRSVVFDVTYDGRGLDVMGKERAGFSAESKISRKEFGMKWNTLIETGGVAVGDQVRISLNIAAVRHG